MPTPGVGGAGLEKLTRRHGVKLCPTVSCSVEECSLAVGEIVGYDSVKSASRMNNGVVIFLDSIDKVHLVVEQGLVIQDTFVQVVPLVNPAKKIILSKVPPFISNDVLKKELSRHGQLMSPIKLIPLGCKSPLLKHVVSFRRQVFMVLKNNTEELNLMLKFRVDDFDYTVYASSEKMKCFGCGMDGHLIRSCPEKLSAEANETAPPTPEQQGPQSPVQEGPQSSVQEGPQSLTKENSKISLQSETESQATELAATGQFSPGLNTAGLVSPGPDSAVVRGVDKSAASQDSAGKSAANLLSGGKGPAALGSGKKDGFGHGSGGEGGAARCPGGGAGLGSVGAHGLGLGGAAGLSSGGDAGLVSDGVSSLDSGGATDLDSGGGAVVDLVDQFHTDSPQCDTGVTQTAIKEAEECVVQEGSEMLVVEEFSKENEKKRKTEDTCQSSSKVKIVSLQSQSLQSDGSGGDEDSDLDSLASSQMWPHKQSDYSLTSIKKFLQDTKGARNVKVGKVFPDLQLFIDSVRTFLRSPGGVGEKSFTDQETYRLKKLVQKVKKRLEDNEDV